MIVECRVVDVLLFLKLFLKVSLLVHFLQYLGGLGSIIMMFCTFELKSMRFSQIALTVEL